MSEVFEGRRVSERFQQAARWLRLVAAATFALASLGALGSSWLSPRPSEVQAPPPRPVTGVRTDVQPKAPAPSEEPPPPPNSSAPPPAAVSRQVLIDLGPARSDVYVDGRRVGQTPFLGQVKCRPGREISIQVIPERGLPLEERRVCPP